MGQQQSVSPGDQAPTMLVTGASSGIGFALATRYARKGWCVYGSVRKEADGKELQEKGVQPVIFDVSDEGAMVAAVERLKGDLGARGLNVLVNNAGVVQMGPLELTTRQEWEKCFSVNVFGLAECTRLFLPLIRKAPERGPVGRRLVLVGSTNGKIALGGQSVYASSKFAVEGLADVLRDELRGQGIKVCLMEPGVIRTGIQGKLQGVNRGVGQALGASQEMEAMYGRLVQQNEDLNTLLAHEANAIPMDLLLKAFDHALTARSPSPRYAVDGQIRVFLWLRSLLSAQWLGDAWFDWLAPRMMRYALKDAKKKVEKFEAREQRKNFPCN